jgi:hypothetical protein
MVENMENKKQEYMDNIMKSSKYSIILFLIIVFDSVSTILIISNGGYEVNPLMRYLLDKSWLLFLVYKISLGMACIGILEYVYRKKIQWNKWYMKNSYMITIISFLSIYVISIIRYNILT